VNTNQQNNQSAQTSAVGSDPLRVLQLVSDLMLVFQFRPQSLTNSKVQLNCMNLKDVPCIYRFSYLSMPPFGELDWEKSEITFFVCCDDDFDALGRDKPLMDALHNLGQQFSIDVLCAAPRVLVASTPESKILALPRTVTAAFRNRRKYVQRSEQSNFDRKL
jgi:hypothetical protein